ncbi:MAG: aromatic ring-hydroxylating dioxygenase subunit alpha [Hyphomicrobiales bacterium]|nr:MAG: aromatic ring-hydroxylating dioxygenase subunit alpha [Hyphomicrobiales bacterium]
MTLRDGMFAESTFAKVRLSPHEAEPLPHWAYTSQDWYDREQERIFRAQWNYIGHASQIPKPGDYFTCDVGGVPLIVTRAQDGTIGAFFNSCRHRGSKLLWDQGNCKLIRCPYHAWAYDLKGNLVATPLVEEEMAEHKPNLGLHRARIEVVDGFLFATTNAKLPSAAETLGSLPKEWAGYDPANLVCTRRKSWEVKANWKLWYENYNDSLHVPFVHPDSLAKQKVAGRQRASHVETDGAYIAHFTMHAGSRGLLTEHQSQGFPRFPNLTGRYTEGTYYPCLLPATLFGFTVDSVWVFELHPKGPDRTTLVAASLFAREATERPDFEEKAAHYYQRVDTIVPEDNEAVERQQEGLCLPVGLSGKFTQLETLCHAFDNWVLDQVVDRPA